MHTHITLLHALATRVCSHDGKSVMFSMPHCDEVRVAQTAVPHGAWPEVGLKVHVGMDNTVCVLRVNATFDQRRAVEQNR
jgi:hypothetical protein